MKHDDHTLKGHKKTEKRVNFSIPRSVFFFFFFLCKVLFFISSLCVFCEVDEGRNEGVVELNLQR